MGLKVEKRRTPKSSFTGGKAYWGVVLGKDFLPMFRDREKTNRFISEQSEDYVRKDYQPRYPLSECPLVSEASPCSYSFVSREEDVDYERILRETPESEDFVLVQTADRRGRPKGWLLLVRNRVLDLPETKNLILDGEYLSGSWGYNVPGVDARSRSGSGKFPAEIKQKIEIIRARLNPKNCRTTVTYL